VANKMVILKDCGHKFCEECVRISIKSKLEVENFGGRT